MEFPLIDCQEPPQFNRSTTEIGTMVQIRSRKKLSARSREERAALVILIVIPSILMGLFICTVSILQDSEPDVPLQSPSTIEQQIISENIKPFKFNKSLLAIRGGKIFRNGMEGVWESFLEEAVAWKKETGEATHVMEVGVHRPKECLYAAKLGLESHCIEPSPRSHDRIMDKVRQEPKDVQTLVRVYQMAASSTTGIQLEFSGNGGTGDHVGSPITELSAAEKQSANSQADTTVSSVAIDDIIYNRVQPTEKTIDGTAHSPINKIFALKIDTQGYEPSVFSGLQKSIQEHKIDFIITEYWPKGMDLMLGASGSGSGSEFQKDKCVMSVNILKLLHNAGYELYASWNISHPKAPQDARSYINDGRINNIPFNDMMAHCKWYYDVEKKYPSDEYQMGYWTDVLAVSPNSRLAKARTTQLSQKVLSEIKRVD